MAISLEEVDKIAKLARLKFNDAEKQKLQTELSSILDYIDQIKSVTENAQPKVVDDADGVNLMRDDVAEEVVDPSKFIKQAPAREGDFLKVKNILE